MSDIDKEPFGTQSAYMEAVESGKDNMTISCELVVELVEALRAAQAPVSEEAEPVAKVVSGYSGDPDTRSNKAIQPLDLSDCKIGDLLYRRPAQQGSVPDGLEQAAQYIEKKASNYDLEHGNTDPSTGAREYPGDGAEYYAEMMELAEEVRSLSPLQQRRVPEGWPPGFLDALRDLITTVYHRMGDEGEDLSADQCFESMESFLSKWSLTATPQSQVQQGSVPEGYVLVEKGITPTPVVEAGLECFGLLNQSGIADDRTLVLAVFQDMLLACEKLAKDTPQPQGDGWIPERCEVGIYGQFYDGPEKCRAYTYFNGPGNADASKLGTAALSACADNAGDSIDRGFCLLRRLHDQGFGVFQLKRPQPPVEQGEE